MRVLYFDCFSGISGDMILGALLDAGLSLEELKHKLKALPIKNYEVKTKKVKRGALSGIKFVVSVSHKKDESRSLKDILAILDKSKLDDDIKENSKKIFTELARVEARIHSVGFKKVHFHELGGIDSIVDIVGFCIAVKLLGIEKIYTSQLPFGNGVARTEHGLIPAASPAALGVLAGSGIRCVFNPSITEELVTPTGASILAVLAEDSGHSAPIMRLSKVGYGAGTREYNNGIPNMLRAVIGESQHYAKPHNPTGIDLPIHFKEGSNYIVDEVMVLEANIDDLNPVGFEYLFELLFKEGALDVFVTPIQMKKSRPGILLTVLCQPEHTSELANIIFDETSTFGIRQYLTSRLKLDKKIKKVRTKFGEVRVKVGFTGNDIKSVSPEYEDCKKIAERHNVPFKVVYDAAKNGA